MNKIKILISLLLILFATPLFFCFAANEGGEVGPIFENPLKVESITDLLALVLDIVVQVGLVVIVFFIIFAGFTYVTARGNTSKIAQAHNALMATLIGAAIVLGSYAIASALKNTVEQLKTGVVTRLEVPNKHYV